MSWRGSTTVPDRIFACLPYLMPLMEGILRFSGPFFQQFPALKIILLPLQPLLGIYLSISYALPFGSLILFLLLYFLVVRNDNISHFIRFNTMQAILIDICLFLCSLIFGFILEPILKTSFLMETLINTVFLGVLAAFIYSVVQSCLGRYAEIPTLSDAVYMQVR